MIMESMNTSMSWVYELIEAMSFAMESSTLAERSPQHLSGFVDQHYGESYLFSKLIQSARDGYSKPTNLQLNLNFRNG